MALNIGDLGSFLEDKKNRQDAYDTVKNSPVNSHVSDGISVHKVETKGKTEYHTLDHNKKEMLHSSTFRPVEASKEIPFNHERQSGVDRTGERGALPRHYILDFLHNHITHSGIPLRTDDHQSTSGHKLWRNLVDKSLSKGHNVYYWDGEKLNKTTHKNKGQHLNDYFGYDPDEHTKRYMIVSKDPIKQV